ncbi:VQ motif-containing protein 11-like [Durio zibethinus]|uniref:VQ motif-containing protein 11-like n=1 Tax=Durio zibethinus TaxID=66656 RepID=A0A6P6BJ31_DURZI|nr:VQ motif-containing protein 11-like [Durio zibethinus]
MASPSNTTTTTMHHPTDPVSTNTTFVQADPSTFRTIVQQLTGASDDPSSPKLPLTHPARPAAASDIGPKKPVFKLHERRRAMKKLEIKLNNNNIGKNEYPSDFFFVRKRGSFLVSPVSTLDFWSRGGSESTRSLVEEEEEKAIAEKGFYLHPSPLNTPRAGAEPELLPLFPLHTPKESSEHDYDATSSSK